MPDSILRIILLAAALLASAAIAAALRRRDRRITRIATGDVLTSADLSAGLAPGHPGGPGGPGGPGVELGARATFVQFSSPVCSGCRAAARVLDGLTAQDDRLRRIEIDVTQRLDLAQRLDIMATPSVVVLGARGEVLSRLTGVPAADQALAAAGLPASHDPAR